MLFRYTAIFTILILFGFSINLYASDFTIHGNIKGINKEWAYFEYLDDETNRQLTDSAFVSGGKFTLTGHIQTPTFGILYFPVSDIQEFFFFEPGSTFISEDTSKPGHLLVIGSKSTEIFSEYRQKADSFKRYRSALMPFISGNKVTGDSAVQAQYMDNYYISLSDEENFTEQFVRKHPDSYVCAYLLFFEFSGENNMNKGVALLNILSPQIQQSKYCRQL